MSEERQKQTVERRQMWRLGIFAAAILYWELAVIRFSSAQVLYLGYFNNFILISAFVGLGLGFLAAKRTFDLDRLIPFFLLFLFSLLLVDEFDVNVLRNHYGLFFFGNRTAQSGLPASILLPTLFLSTVLLFAALAQQTARLFERFTPLVAYTLDVVGSLAGIGLFSLQSAAWSGPVTWVITGSLLLVIAYLLAPRRQGTGASPYLGRAAAVVGGAVAVVILLAASRPVHTVVWSTYQKLEYVEGRGGRSRLIYANGLPHQFLHSADVADKLVYQIPYRVHGKGKLDRVLIIGAGSGTDLAVALRRGAGAVDAVEIDEGIVDLGRLHHPDRPYQDKRVSVHIADGRQFLRQRGRQYDLIIFALPDSLTRLSSMSDVRLESYLFTIEALQDARRRLAPNGRLVLYNQYRWQWLRDKIGAMLEQVFEHPPQRLRFQGNTVFHITRSAKANGAARRSKSTLKPATDDWPFLYMQRPRIHWLYIGIIGMFLVSAIIGVGLIAPRGTLRRPDWPFFCLGAAFLLLETKSISLFSLLFGTTWMVNSLAFSGILLSVLAANLCVARWRIRRRWILFACLLGALLLAYLIPAASLLDVQSLVLRYVAVVLLLFAPIFCANLVFSRLFRDTEASTRAFGWNMLGAVAGGGLEYLALLWGHRNLLWVVALCYLLTAALLAREKLRSGQQR